MLPTFPSRYWFTIGLRQYLAFRDGPRGFGQDSTCPALLRWRINQICLPLRDYHPLRSAFPGLFQFADSLITPLLQPRSVRKPIGLGSSRFARHYSGNRCFFLFLRVLRCFSSPRVLRPLRPVPGLQPGGLPHSDTSGSIPVCKSPDIFAAYRVLRRLPKPRHPPYALASLSL